MCVWEDSLLLDYTVLMQISLSGKVAIVTGASSGIGLAITRTFLDCGADGVVAGVLRPTEMPEELKQCGAKYGDKLQVVYGDVAEEATAMRLTQAAVESFGRINVFVSNAGVSVVRPIH